MTASPFSAATHYQPTEIDATRDPPTARRFAGGVADEYRLLQAAAGLFDRGDRGLARLTGADRATWLHNMVTNAVRTLDSGAGVYAFACDAKGRIQFDLNILMTTDEILLDLDRAFMDAALAHLNRFLIMEAAELVDARDGFARIGCGGADAARIAAALGQSHFAAMPDLAHVVIDGAARFVKSNFTGGPAFELIVPRDAAGAWWDRMFELGARPVGGDALDVARIEAGVPWLGRDIDSSTLPAETGQIERGISYHKGCYLGQEIVERMRAYGSLARKLVRLRTANGDGVALPAALRMGDTDAGRVTSLVKHPLRDGWIGLGYLRTKAAAAEGLTFGDPPRAIEVVT